MFVERMEKKFAHIANFIVSLNIFSFDTYSFDQNFCLTSLTQTFDRKMETCDTFFHSEVALALSVCHHIHCFDYILINNHVKMVENRLISLTFSMNITRRT